VKQKYPILVKEKTLGWGGLGKDFISDVASKLAFEANFLDVKRSRSRMIKNDKNMRSA